MFRAHQFAEMTGVTVRTLHHYDRIGLLKPPQRTPAGHRLYDSQDAERLESICALRLLGLSLRQIKSLLPTGSLRLEEALGVQRRLLEEKRTALDQAIRALAQAESQLQAGVSRNEVLKNVMEAIRMHAEEDWMEKYVTEEARAKMEARRQAWSPELQERVSRQWSELIADVERALGDDPLSAKAQSLAARWNALVEEFTGRDQDIQASVGAMWADRDQWPAHMDAKTPVIRPEVWQFIARANRVKSAR